MSNRPDITIPRPHVPYGPHGVPEDEADANYLRDAARKLEEFYKPFGSNLRATIVQLISDTADAIEEGARRTRGVPDCECGAQMNLGSHSTEGSGCDWLCWRCIGEGNPPGVVASESITASAEQIAQELAQATVLSGQDAKHVAEAAVELTALTLRNAQVQATHDALATMEGVTKAGRSEYTDGMEAAIKYIRRAIEEAGA